MLNGHGDDTYNYEKQIVSNFSSNVYNNLDLSPLHSFLYSQLKTIHTYPEPDAHSLAKALAEKNNLQLNQICVTNGATEAIYLISQVFKGKRSSILIPTFSEYEDACRINDHKLSFITSIDDLDDDVQVLWICNPNNPTGLTLDKNRIINLINENSDLIIVIDQSYEHFTIEPMLRADEAVLFKNVILLHSMTKHYTIPGLRLGYITAHNDLIKLIAANKMPWSVNQLAIEAGKFLIKNDLSAQLCIEAYLIETKRLQDQLAQINGLEVYPTDTHFFLCRLKDKKAADLKDYLVNNYGLLIRDAANFRGLDTGYFRIAAQSEYENNQLVKAIEKWIKLY